MHVSHLLTDQAALGHQEVPLFEKEATPTKRSPMDKGSEPHIYGGPTCIDYKPYINFKQREHSSHWVPLGSSFAILIHICLKWILLPSLFLSQPELCTLQRTNRSYHANDLSASSQSWKTNAIIQYNLLLQYTSKFLLRQQQNTSYIWWANKMQQSAHNYLRFRQIKCCRKMSDICH